MDLGATVCRPKAPLCDRCPVPSVCAGLATGAPETYPRKTAKADRPRRYGVAYRPDARRRRSPWSAARPGACSAACWRLPTSDWRATPWTDAEAAVAAPTAGAWRRRDGGAFSRSRTSR